MTPGDARAALDALATSLRREIVDSASAAAPVDLDDPIGRLARMDAIAQQSVADAGRQRAMQRLAQVESARQRVDDGDWGCCVACGEDIDPRRLAARPEVPWCVPCQQARGG